MLKAKSCIGPEICAIRRVGNPCKTYCLIQREALIKPYFNWSRAVPSNTWLIAHGAPLSEACDPLNDARTVSLKAGVSGPDRYVAANSAPFGNKHFTI